LPKTSQGSPLDQLLEEGIITEVVGRLQSGKEAEVFLVRFGERVVAAKVYKDKSQRSFKNKAAYQEGRAVRNTRDQRAMDRRSRFGKGAEEDVWKSAEADALYRLHAAEVRVPTPVLFFEGVLLMDLVLDADGVTARRLIDTTLEAEQANAAYHDMLTQLVRMLACDLIHGDLSPYNVLWGAHGATIIDFPQIVSAAQNSNSERFFLRDAENILGYFRSFDPRLQARRGDAAEIWRSYMRRELTPDFVPTGKAQPPPPQRPLPIAPRNNAAHGSRPQSHGGYPARPQNHGGYAARPQSNGGHSARPQTQGGHSARPQTQGGHSARPQSNGGHSARPQSNGGHSARPQTHGGQSPRAQGRRGDPSGVPNGNQPRANASPQRPRTNPTRPAGRNFGQARRAMPEVIVRPRAPTMPSAPAPAAPATEASPASSRPSRSFKPRPR
jgi:RIO kinase 1